MKLKRWMQALVFTTVLWLCPLSDIMNTGEKNKGAEDVNMGKYEKTTSADAGETEPAPEIALTFDDGPNKQYTPLLLDGLKERGVKATFFVIGANIEKAGGAEILRRMREEGHLIGNHTFHHIELSELSSNEAEEEILMTDRLICEVTGEFTEFVRPPFGAFPQSEEVSDKLYVKWTVDSRDWMIKNTEQIVDSVVTQTGENDIILMHDCYETSVEAALKIIDIFQKKGFEFVTLDKIIIE